VRFGLLHSPFLTAASWGELPAAFLRRGHEVVTVSVTGDEAPGAVSAYAHAAAAQLVGPPVVLVAHSGAGPLLPVVATRRDFGGVLGGLFLDALLPGRSGESRLATLHRVDPDRASGVARDLYAGGTAPHWPEEDRRGLVLRPRGLDFFTEPIPVPSAGWVELSWGYLRTSAAYDAVADTAEALGHPVLRRDLGHLGALTDPESVAANLLALAAALPTDAERTAGG